MSLKYRPCAYCIDVTCVACTNNQQAIAELSAALIATNTLLETALDVSKLLTTFVNDASQVNVAATSRPKLYVGETALVSLALEIDGYYGLINHSERKAYVEAEPLSPKSTITEYFDEPQKLADEKRRKYNIIFVHADHPNYRHLFNPT